MMGPKAEERRQEISRQLPTPDDAVISQSDQDLLVYLLSHKTGHGAGPLRRFAEIYGSSINQPSLRLALSVFFSIWRKETPDDVLIRRAINQYTVINSSDPSECDMVAIVLLGFSLIFIRTSTPFFPNVAILATFIALQFRQTVLRLLRSRSTLNCDFKRLWNYLYPDVPYRTGVWDTHASRRSYLRTYHLLRWLPYIEGLCWVLPEHIQNGFICYDLIHQQYIMACKCLCEVLTSEYLNNSTPSPYILQHFEECQTVQRLFQDSEQYHQMIERFGSPAPPFEPSIIVRSRTFKVLYYSAWMRLSVALVLRGRSVKHALESDESFAAAQDLIFWLAQPEDEPKLGNPLYGFTLLCAALVYRISKDEGSSL